MKKILALSLTLLTLTGCTSYMPMRYQIEADNNAALRSLGTRGVAVGPIMAAAPFSNTCRGINPITPPSGLSFEAYIQRALMAELKVADMYDEKQPLVTLSGTLEKLQFNTVRTVLGGGQWDIGLQLRSSNGQSMRVEHSYEFTTGYYADTACRQTAEAFLPAVQTTLLKLVSSPEFKTLLVPAPTNVGVTSPAAGAR